MKPIPLEAIREHYDRLSPLYARFWGEHIHHGYWRNGESAAAAQEFLMVRLAALAGIPRGARVLDVGSGLGGPALWLAREFGCAVRGITISPVQVELATARARRTGLAERVGFELHDANALGFADAAFDVVWSVECLEHLRDRADFLRRCARALRPGGRLAFSTWLAPAGEAPRPELLAEICAAMLCPPLGSARSYAAALGASGFTDVRVEDVSAHVARTWTRAEEIVGRPEVKLLLPLADDATRRFAAAIPRMTEAYAAGAMRYGLFAARRPAA